MEQISKKIKNIEFGIISPKVMKKISVAKIVTPELYDKDAYPVDGGLMDTRLGVIDPGLRCKTCNHKVKECPGHFGYIELARPAVHIKFVPLLVTILKCTCRDCGRVLIPGNKIEKVTAELDEIEKESGLGERRKRIKSIIASLKTTNKCPHCKARQQKIELEKPTTFIENEKRLSPIEVRTRLEKVPGEDLVVFGINPEAARPEWTILTILLIPPVTMRPSITLESGERSEDDLTHKLGDIVRINQRLFENINAGAPEIIIEDLWDLLQYHITTYFDNAVAQLPPARHRSGQPLKTLTERIKSKEGRIRHNLAGKRTNFSGRTVVSPDPMLKLNEVGVPREVAMKLTVPERITVWNLEYLKKFLERGHTKYPGCNYIIRPDGKRKKVTSETKEQLLEEFQPGFIVERHLMDGDVALFNRQPSLHRMSMMCHKVRVIEGKTFRINPAVCHPYNADFDGDEMNLHIPQTEESRAEAEVLMQVQTQMISPRYGLSVLGCIQDGIAGNYVLTKYMKMSRNEAIELLFDAGIFDISKLPNKKELSGKEIFSVLLPEDFSFRGSAKSKTDEDFVVIEKGTLKAGVMDSANLGEGKGLLLRNLHGKYGEDAALEILGNMLRLGTEVMLKRGFSLPISDYDMPVKANDKIQSTINKAYEDVDKMIKDYKDDKLEPFPGKTPRETLELKILERLNNARNDTGRVVIEFAKQETQTMILAMSGARGNLINLSQISGCIGQQAIRGGRIVRGFTDRTLPCFNKGDLRPDARGFIKNSFRKGMKPSEFFFMAMTGREALMDTALRTPKSGYLYRRLANAMQDLKVEYDGTVRASSKNIIQFDYGEDGVDVSKSEKGKLDVKRIITEIGE
jgi:DNA-directed RNA polymerase subunit A'